MCRAQGEGGLEFVVGDVDGDDRVGARGACHLNDSATHATDGDDRDRVTGPDIARAVDGAIRGERGAAEYGRRDGVEIVRQPRQTPGQMQSVPNARLRAKARLRASGV